LYEYVQIDRFVQIRTSLKNIKTQYLPWRNDEIMGSFVRDIAANHLPHIYTALHEIAKRQGITLPETPMVRFVDLNGNRRRSE
jgi:hypothetical protein